MRIGNLEYLDRSPRSEFPPRMEEPELSPTQRKLKKWKNFWYYYKWYIICGVILLLIIGNVAGSALGLWEKKPDLQIAYIGKTGLPQDTVTALEQAFSSIASDYNNDGKVIVKLKQYTDGLPTVDAETAYYEYASEISLIGDISDCDSYFFLLEDPEQFQREFQLLASPDGSCPDDKDYSVQDKVILWSECSVLSTMELGAYTSSTLGIEESGSNQSLLSDLYLARRCFFTDKITDNAAQCGELWDFLAGN